MHTHTHNNQIRFDFAGATHVGRVRQVNEDSFLAVAIPGQGDVLLAVADGVGGRDVGDIASQMVLRQLLDARMKALREGVDMTACAQDMQVAIKEANLFLFKLNQQFGNAKFATGTTLTTLHLYGLSGGIYNVGDSRCYRLRRRRLDCLTHDDTLVQKLVDDHRLRQKDADNHPLANTLYRCMGSEPTARTGFQKVASAPGDRLIVATDGVWKVLSPEQISLAIADAGSAGETVERLMCGALREGSHDNLSACAVFLQ